MKLKLDENWTTTNNGYPLNDAEVARYNAVLPSQRQILQSQNPFYCFIHYGMNTATGREWGNATETLRDFDITKIKPINDIPFSITIQIAFLNLLSEVIFSISLLKLPTKFISHQLQPIEFF